MVAALCSTRWRNIPACAGKTIRPRRQVKFPGEHPRVRGENRGLRMASNFGTGTSPRARGKPAMPCRSKSRAGNIPACAGKTVNRPRYLSRFREHPRVRGENSLSHLMSSKKRGTSPRARGKRLLTCGSSFLRVILHSILFFCTVGVPWNPPAAPSFLSVLVPESSFTASSGPACFRLTAALFGGTVDDF